MEDISKIDVIQDMEKLIAEYQWTYDNSPSMLKMYKNDRKEFKKIVKHVKNGKWDKAWNVVFDMDTAPRDCIPQRTYNFLMAQYENTIKK